jgi:hypothetical protein
MLAGCPYRQEGKPSLLMSSALHCTNAVANLLTALFDDDPEM